MYYVLCIVPRIYIEYLYKMGIFRIIKPLAQVSQDSHWQIWNLSLALPSLKLMVRIYIRGGRHIFLNKKQLWYSGKDNYGVNSSKVNKKENSSWENSTSANLISNRNIRSVRVHWIWNLKIIEIFFKVRIVSCFILFFLILWIFHVLMEWINRLWVFHWNIRHIFIKTSGDAKY